NKSYCQLKRISHEYDQYGHVTKEYHFDANNELNYTIHKAYNDHGLLVSETDPLGRSQHYSYDNNGNKTYIQGVNPEVCTHYSYDLCNRLVSEEEVHADGVVLTSHYSYDFLDHLIKKVDPYGAETLYEYDSLGNQVKIIHPFVADTQGGVYRPMIEKRYDDLGHVIWEKDPNGTETHIKTTIKGKPYETTINGHQTTSCTYTLSGQIATSTSPNGDKTIFTYDALDREIKKEVYGANGEFLGLITSTYDAFHILSKTNEEGVTTTYSYDLAGRLIAEQVGDHKTTYHYDSLGNKDKTLNWIDDNNFIASHVTHDLAGRVVQETVVDTHGNLLKKVNYEYDIAGNRTTVIVDCSDGLLDISKKIYNSRKQIIESIDALNRSTTYQYELVNHCNVNGIKTSEVDPMGLKTVFIKDNLGRLNHISKYNKDGLPIFLEEKRYDGNNNLILQDDYVRQNGVALRTQRSSWIYGPKNRLEKQILATGTIDEQITEHLYDDKGRLSTTIKADGVRVNFEYDGKGRLKRRHSFGNETIRPIDDVFEYNLCDNIVRVIDNITGHVSLRNYDTYQNVIAETLNNQTLNFSYDNLNRQIGLTLPDQSSVNYIYGALHLNAIQRLDVNQHIQYTHDYLERDLRGNVLKSQGLEGVQEYTYDILGRYSSITSEFFAENDYLYDDVDNLHSLTSKDIRGTRQHTFSYDELYQLTSENGEGYHTYSNDSLSNRVEYDNNICTINFLNQHLLDHQGPCHYNKAGNLTNRNNCKFTYDALDRLVSSLINEETRADYTYDSWHRRLTKSVYKLVDGSWTLYSSLNYLYEGQNEIGAMDDHGQIVEFRVLGEGLGAEIGSAISIKLDGKIYGVIHDQRGCVRALVQDGQLVEGYAYTAYGIEKIFNGSNQVLQHSEIDNPWRFSSKRTDSETGLVYFGRRFYIPELGRWMTQDPEGYRDGPNLYAYVHNDPFNSIDLYGLQTMPMPAFEPVRFTGFDYISAIGFCAVQGVLYPQDVICQDWKDAKKLLHPLLLLQTIKNTPNDQLAMMITERMGSKLGLTLSALLLAVSCGDSAPLTTACGKVINKAVPGITRVFVRGAVQQSVQRAGTEVCQRVVVRQEFLKSIGNRVDQLKYECLNNMSKSGKSLDRGGLTRAGRALDKHGNRPGSPFPKAVGNHISKNKQGQFHLDDILTNPNSNIELIDLCNYRTFVPDGRGAYFYSDGTLRGFLKNPNWQKP
ncbi:MAG: RHS repeat-associated core domain-containing protein, partial [Parachlamydiales bacterium]|nr:RHS repeat-associated core domain-containing protein [Parachlamydiales bacterium]